MSNSLDNIVPPSRLRPRELIASCVQNSGVLGAMRRMGNNREWVSSDRGLPWPRKAEPRFVILCYHRVGLAGVPLYSKLDPGVFESQMRYLRKYYRVLSLTEVLGEQQRPVSARPAVAVTFDDGYRDLFDYALPALQKYSIPATIFPIVEAIETGVAPWYDWIFVAIFDHPGSFVDISLEEPTRLPLDSAYSRLAATDRIVRWLRRKPEHFRREFLQEFLSQFPADKHQLANRMLTWDQLRVMQTNGVSCGSHTLTHPVMSRVNPEQKIRELRDSREILQRQLGGRIEHFAFPFGQPSDCLGVLPEDLRSCGYRSALTMSPGVNRQGTNPFSLLRVSIGEQRHLPLFALWLAQFFMGPNRLSVSPIESAASKFSTPVANPGDSR